MKRYLTILNLLLATVAVFLGVQLFYKVVTARLTYPVATERPRARIAPVKTDAVQPLTAYAAIAERDLFKLGKAEPPPVETVDIESLQQTELSLKLWGTVAGTGGRSYAVIEDTKKREQNLYHEGDTLQDATLKMILREKVILSVQGRDEILEMEKLISSAAPAGRPTAGTPAPTRARNITLKRDQIQSAVSDLNALMSQVRIRPHFSDGQPDGIALSNIRATSIFRKMGLRNGDVLMAVNEQEIRSVDDALNFYNNLKASPNVSLKIKRRGRENTINYTIE